MTYLGFHARFNLPASLLLAALLAWKGGLAWAEVGMAFAVLIPVYLFAAPWDNWAVQRGIWGFDEHRTGARVGWLPWEEYLFFGWQSLNVAGTVALLFRLVPDWKRGGETPISPATFFAVLAVLIGWAAVVDWWKQKPRSPRWGYAWHLLSWFLPVIAIEWAVAPFLLFDHLAIIASAGAIWGAYYTLADLVAVKSGLWFFDRKQIQGGRLFGIPPWEEALFFLLTSILVAQSYVLLLPAVLR